MTFVFILSLINILAPLCVVVVILLRQHLLKRRMALVVIPSAVLMSIFYAFLEFAGHNLPDFNVSLMKFPLRAVIASLLLSLLIYFTADLIVARRAVNGDG